MDNRAIEGNIALLAVVGGKEVTNPFQVREVYTCIDRNWKRSPSPAP